LPQYPCYLDDAVVVFEECVRSAGQRLVPGTHIYTHTHTHTHTRTRTHAHTHTQHVQEYMHLEGIGASKLREREREISMFNEHCRVPADEVSIRLIGNHHEDFVAYVVLHWASDLE